MTERAFGNSFIFNINFFRLKLQLFIYFLPEKPNLLISQVLSPKKSPLPDAKYALTDPTTKIFFPAIFDLETLCTGSFCGCLISSYLLKHSEICTSNRSCMNEWGGWSLIEGGHTVEVKQLKWSLFDWGRRRTLSLRRAKKTVVRRGSEGTSGYRIRKETHYGESDCQAETGQFPSEHSEKREILENTPDCIWILQARGFKIYTPLQPAGCLLPWFWFSPFCFHVVYSRRSVQYLLCTFTKKAAKESEMVNWRNCPGRIF